MDLRTAGFVGAGIGEWASKWDKIIAEANNTKNFYLVHPNSSTYVPEIISVLLQSETTAEWFPVELHGHIHANGLLENLNLHAC